MVALLVACGCGGAKERPAKVVSDLRIEGNDALSSRTIKKRILTAETGWWPLARERGFDAIAWDTDLERIERLYESRGYHTAEVEGEVEPRGDRDVVLWVRIREGPPTRIVALDIVGLEALPADVREAVLDELPVREGAVLEEAAWNAAKSEMRTRLRDRGYAEAEVSGIVRVELARREAHVRIDVRPGRTYQFGAIRIENPRSVIDPAWVRDEVAVALGSKRRFSDAKLREAERRVFSMGLFGTVRVTTGAPDRENGLIPVIVEVSDAPFRTLRAGGGIGFDQIRNEGRVFTEWTHRNFRGGMRRLELRLQAGWAFIPNAYAVLRDTASDAPRSGPIARATARFEQPRLFEVPTLSLRTLVEGERRLEQAYTSIGARGNVGIAWRPWVDFAVMPAYQIEAARVDAPGTVTPDVAPQVLGCSENPCFQLLSFLEQTATWDGRDHPLSPRSGHYASLSLQEGGGPLGGDFDYLRVTGDVRAYVTPAFLDEQLTFAWRAQVGALFPRDGRPDESPISQRFYAGGAVSMRGYNSRRLSPLLGVPVPGASPDDQTLITLPIGGDGMIVGSFEMRWAFSPSLQLAVFVDAGQVTRGAPRARDVGRLIYAVGVGLRYLTPVGPIRLDFARRLPFGTLPTLYVPGGTRAYADDTSCFGIGGTRDPAVRVDSSCVLHISIGEAF